MFTRVRDRLTFANVMSVIAVFIALGGTTWALSRNSVGPQQIQRNAVRSPDVKNEALKGVDVNEATLGQVPSAQSANDAQSANAAQTADLLDGLDSADFLRSGAKAADAELIDGQDSSAFAPANEVQSTGRVTMSDSIPGDGEYTEQPILTAGNLTLEGWCAQNFGGAAEDRAGIQVDVPIDRSLAAAYTNDPFTSVNNTGGAGIFVPLALGTGNVVRGAWASIVGPGNQVVSLIGSAEVNPPGSQCVMAANVFGP